MSDDRDPLDVHGRAMASAREEAADDPDEVLLDGLDDDEAPELPCSDGNLEGLMIATLLRKREGAPLSTLEIAQRTLPFKGAQIRLFRSGGRLVWLNIRRSELRTVAAALLACLEPAKPADENPFSAAYWVGAPARPATPNPRARRGEDPR